MSLFGYITGYPLHMVAILSFCIFYTIATIFYDRSYKSYIVIYILLGLLFSILIWSSISKNSAIYYAKNIDIFSVFANHLLFMFVIVVVFISIHLMTNFLIRQRIFVVTTNSRKELSNLTERLFNLSSERIADLHKKYYNENCLLIKEISLLKKEMDESVVISKEVSERLVDINKLIVNFNRTQEDNTFSLKTSTEQNLQLIVNKIADMVNHTSEIVGKIGQNDIRHHNYSAQTLNNVQDKAVPGVTETDKVDSDNESVIGYVDGSFMENHNVPINKLFVKDRKKHRKDKVKDFSRNAVPVNEIADSEQERDKLYSTLKNLLQIK